MHAPQMPLAVYLCGTLRGMSPAVNCTWQRQAEIIAS